VIRSHALGGCFERGALGGREPVQRMPQLAAGQFEFGHAAGIEMIEAARVLEHRGIARGAHALEDFADREFDGIVGRVIEVQQFIERGKKAGVSRPQTANHLIAPSIAAMTGCNSSRFIFSAA
jgi:hypothetical protein